MRKSTVPRTAHPAIKVLRRKHITGFEVCSQLEGVLINDVTVYRDGPYAHGYNHRSYLFADISAHSRRRVLRALEKMIESRNA